MRFLKFPKPTVLKTNIHTSLLKQRHAKLRFTWLVRVKRQICLPIIFVCDRREPTRPKCTCRRLCKGFQIYDSDPSIILSTVGFGIAEMLGPYLWRNLLFRIVGCCWSFTPIALLDIKAIINYIITHWIFLISILS
jgi:hypothetical protein